MMKLPLAPDKGKKLSLLLVLILLALAGFAPRLGPGPDSAWVLEGSRLVRLEAAPDSAPLDPTGQADLNGDGQPESLSLAGDRLEIRSQGQAVWRSPESWQVLQAEFTDLNRDGVPEAALLVWRAFQPWPVDRVLPHGGRIAGFHDADGMSCHLILIGWINGVYREVWAGSALAQPLLGFAAADLDGDGRQELAALQGDYARSGRSSANALTAWEWNGFGFTIIDRVEGTFRSVNLLAGNGHIVPISARK